MQLGLSEVAFHRDHQIETGEVPDADGLSEPVSGIDECLLDPFAGIGALLTGHAR